MASQRNPTPAPTRPAADSRQRLIRLIHVARRELGLDEATYRVMLQRAGRASSTAQMDVQQLRAVVEAAKRGGFKVRASLPDRQQDTSDQARKVRALWLDLHALGAVRDPSERALASYVKRIAGVDDLHWASSAEMSRLIETLKKWVKRCERVQHSAVQQNATQQSPGGAP